MMLHNKGWGRCCAMIAGKSDPHLIQSDQPVNLLKKICQVSVCSEGCVSNLWAVGPVGVPDVIVGAQRDSQKIGGGALAEIFMLDGGSSKVQLQLICKRRGRKMLGKLRAGAGLAGSRCGWMQDFPAYPGRFRQRLPRFTAICFGRLGGVKSLHPAGQGVCVVSACNEMGCTRISPINGARHVTAH